MTDAARDGDGTRGGRDGRGESGVTVRVPAKVNLELLVGPRGDDGYHDVSTIFHAVSLYDDVTVTPADDWSVSVSGPYAHLVPETDDNLALRAARALAEHAGLDRPVHVDIAKEIPVAAGLAGGSADAAGALLACDQLWGLGSEPETLHEIAATLGSDVNFALTGGTALGSGRGERIAPVLARGRYHWVLVFSDAGLSTPAVYAECDRLREAAGDEVDAPEPSAAMMSALRSGDPRDLGRALTNDLQEAALSLRPDLAEVLESGREVGALGALVSGSGPTVAFLVDGPEGALDLAVALTAIGTTQVKRVCGPAHGAHVLAAPPPPTHPSRRAHPSGASGGRGDSPESSSAVVHVLADRRG